MTVAYVNAGAISSSAGSTSRTPALPASIVAGNLLIAIPLVTFLFAPSKTRAWIERSHTWLRTRGRKEFAAILAGMGLLQLVIGLARL